MIKMLLCFCCLCLSGMVQVVASEQSTVVLNNATTTIDVFRQLATLKAGEKGLSIEEVSAAPMREQFKPNSSQANNYGYNRYDFWLRFDIRSESSQTWYLLIDQVVFGRYELFIRPKEQADVLTPVTSEPYFSTIEVHRTPVWKLKLPTGQAFTAYIKINSPKGPLMLPVKLMQDDEFLLHSNYQYAFFAMVLASLVILILYNFILSFTLRDKAHLVFVLLLFVMLLALYRFMNLFPPLFDVLVDSERWYFVSLLFLSQVIGACYWFILFRDNDIALSFFLQGLIIISLLFCVVSAITELDNQLFAFNCIVLMVLVPLVVLRSLIKDKVKDLGTLNTYTIPTILVVSLAAYAPLYSGLFPSYPVESIYIGMVGHVLAIFLFSMNHAAYNRELYQQAQLAETGKQATQNFLANMSHELRTPMHTVLGASELLTSTGLNREQKGYLDSLELASRQMLRLVDDILYMARLNNAKPVSLREQPFNLSYMLADIEKMVAIQARHKQLNFSVSIRSVSASCVVGDDARLSQVLVNLISNAIKYTETGTVTLSVEGLDPGADRETQSIYFAVQDSGPGIPEEQQSLLFQPFYQADNSHRRRQGGAGLGLAISQRLVQQMGGELNLSSGVDQGSCFFFTLNLPLHQATCAKTIDAPNEKIDAIPVNTPKSTPSNSHSPLPLSGLNILLVDDGELNRMIGEKLLVLQGAQVTQAHNGRVALQILNEASFDLVLMDISMPDMDGYQATRALRAIKVLSTLPVIALTAHAIAGEEERCLAAGMNAYLSKPFQTEQLLQLIKLHVR